MNEQGEVIRNKARLVAQGYNQESWMNPALAKSISKKKCSRDISYSMFISRKETL